MNKKEQALKKIHIFGRLYLLLGVLDIFMMIAGFLADQDELGVALATNGLSKGINYGFLMIVVAFTLVAAFMKIYVGYQGLSCSYDKKPNKASMLMTKLLFVLSILGLIVQVMGIFTGTGDFVALSSAAATLLILYYFRQNIDDLERY